LDENKLMLFEEFEILVKESLSNLFDYAAMETTPLSVLFATYSEQSGSKGEFLRKLILESIDTLKPNDKAFDANANEWRTYTILNQRYIENLNSLDVARNLSISERQLRRYQRKAVEALAYRLWDRYQTINPEARQTTSASDSNIKEFIVNLEEINLWEVVSGVNKLLAATTSEDHVELKTQNNETLWLIESDRIILRQILIGLMNQFFQLLQEYETPNRLLTFSFFRDEEKTTLNIDAPIYIEAGILSNFHTPELKKNLNFWSQEINIQINEKHSKEQNKSGLILEFPHPQKKLILVVDDQEPALRMYERYLSRTKLKIVGLTKPSKVVSRAKELKPALIVLDIMMPKVDGWEVLQSLKLDEGTRNIPVIVCSAWGEPELATSLGAVGFLKKPVIQRDLLAIIQKLKILDD
jgi:CheY-like chemotaxis protein